MSSKQKALAQIGHQAHLRWKHDPQLLLGGWGEAFAEVIGCGLIIVTLCGTLSLGPDWPWVCP